MLLATLLATNKCVGGQMLVKIYLFGGRFFVRNEVIMKVESGKFYFIKDEFFDVFKGYKLMDNKENGNKRPCYFCFNDPENERIIWFVPISSKVDKYKTIYENKKRTRKKVYNFVFGKVLGKEKAFLIQNIFPTTEDYIESKYQNKLQDVEITESLKKEIIETSINVIKLAKKGIHIPFYNIIEMKNVLLRNRKIERIMQLNKNIDNISLKGTSYFEFRTEQELNEYDKKIINYYDEILELLIDIAKEEKIQDIKVIDNMFENYENTASQILEDYIEELQFYSQFNMDATKREIVALNKIKDNFKFDFEQEMTNLVDLADCYFRIGNEEKARDLMLEFIKKNPDEDEPYQCMQNWYMYDSPNLDKLAEVIDLAEKNGHVLITDFGYDRLVKYYEMIGDTENQQKYQEFYDKWKKNIKN